MHQGGRKNGNAPKTIEERIMNLLRLKVHSIQYVEAQYSYLFSTFKGRYKYIKKFNHYKSQGFRWLYDYLRIRRAYLKETNLKTGSTQTLKF